MLQTGALPGRAIDEWLAAEPRSTCDLSPIASATAHSGRGPAADRHDAAEVRARAGAGRRPRRQSNGARVKRATLFLRAHAPRSTARSPTEWTRFVRVEDVLFAAADAFPGLTPDARADRRGDRHATARQGWPRDRPGHPDLAHLGAGSAPGCTSAMPCCCRARDAGCARKLRGRGVLDLGAVRLERHGRAIHLIMSNPRFLNAEDQATIDAMEIGVDVAILDPASDIAVLRGGPSSIPNIAAAVSSAAAST